MTTQLTRMRALGSGNVDRSSLIRHTRIIVKTDGSQMNLLAIDARFDTPSVDLQSVLSGADVVHAVMAVLSYETGEFSLPDIIELK